MRRLSFMLVLLLVGVIALSGWRPGAAGLPPAATATATLLPENFTLIPTFAPAYPCELEQVEVHDDPLCRFENVEERVIVTGEGVVFIQHDYHMGQGCWDGVSEDVHELRVCNSRSGAVTTLTTSLTSAPLPSPNGSWLIFGTTNPLSTEGDALRPHVYRVRPDGTGLQRLDAKGFPDFAVGAPGELRWLDDEWVALMLWDGTTDGYHAYRLKADGSGVYEPLPDVAVTEAG